MIYTVYIIVFILFLILILFAIMPSFRRHPDRKLLENKCFAHRGLYDEELKIPENSLLAFDHAISYGYGIELDIRLTKDGEIVVFHDNCLKRMCGNNINVNQLNLIDIKKFNLGNTQEKIPTLKETLAFVDGRVPLIIEYKCEISDYRQLCEKSIKELAGYTGRYVIESFNPMVTFWFKKNKKAVMRGQLAIVPNTKRMIEKLPNLFLTNFLTKPDFVAFDQKGKKSIVFRLQKILGAFPVGWTIHSQKRLDECKKDFKAFIFEKFKP